MVVRGGDQTGKGSKTGKYDVCACVCAWVRMRACVRARGWVCVCVRGWVCICVRGWVCVCACAFIRARARVWWKAGEAWLVRTQVDPGGPQQGKEWVRSSWTRALVWI